MTARVVALFALFAVFGCSKKPDADTPQLPPAQTETDEQKARGVWRIVGVEAPPSFNHTPLFSKETPDMRLIVNGNLVTLAHLSGLWGGDEYVTFKCDPTATPNAVDFFDADANGKRRDNTWVGRGVYKFEGDELHLALAIPNGEEKLEPGKPKPEDNYRPTEFKPMELVDQDERRYMTVIVLRGKKADPGEKIKLVPSSR